MKNIFALAALTLVLMPQFAFASFDTNLKYGNSGPKVLELQEFLIDQGYMQGIATGNFYSVTLRAIKAFQTAQNIKPISGFWGSFTRAAAQNILSAEIAASNQEASTTSVVTAPMVVPIVQSTNQPTPTPQITPRVTTLTPTTLAASAQTTTSPAPSLAQITLLGGNGYPLNTGSNTYQSLPPTCTLIPYSFPHQLANDANCNYGDSNELRLDIEVTGADGYISSGSTVTITATDARQNETVTGTDARMGDTPYYSYTYMLTTPGQNTITVSANSVSTSTTFAVQ